jgi:hypothetical protein
MGGNRRSSSLHAEQRASAYAVTSYRAQWQSRQATGTRFAFAADDIARQSLGAALEKQGMTTVKAATHFALLSA